MDERFFEEPYAFSRHIGFRMVEWRESYALFELPMEAFHLNRHGNLHGGVHATLLDTVMGYAGCWTGDPDRRQMCLTLSLNVQYLSRSTRPVLLAEGQKTGGGRSTFFATATVRDDLGEILATGTGVFKYRSGA